MLFAAIASLMLVGGSAATAGPGDNARTSLSGFEEVPAVSTNGDGNFRADISVTDRELDFRLRYEDLSAPVEQAHIHFGQLSVNGGVAVFLCSNLGNGPDGTPTCPDSGVVAGSIEADDVVGPAGQGIDAGQFRKLVRAINNDVAYVNVHTEKFPGGELRGQLGRG